MSDAMIALKTMPAGLKYAGGIMNNHDGEIRARVEAQVRAGTHWGQYGAADFFGKVWFADGQFHCEIRCWRKHQETLSGTLEEIMDRASDSWGYE